MADDTDHSEFGSHTFVKGVGLTAAGSALGLGSTDITSAAYPLELEFANSRAREASKVREKGYRGHPDRAIGLIDSGIEARHPDLGPWNGVQATVGNDDLVLVDPTTSFGNRERTQVGSEQSESATVGPGAFPAESETVITEFSPSAGNVEEFDATLSWQPTGDASNDLEFRIDIELSDGSWEAVACVATASMPEELNEVPVGSANNYRFVAERYLNTTTQVTVTLTYRRYTGSLNTLSEDTVPASDISGSDSVTRTYFVEATGSTGQSTFGPAEATLEDATGFANGSATFGGGSRPPNPRSPCATETPFSTPDAYPVI
jgi:hypothetical protein